MKHSLRIGASILAALLAGFAIYEFGRVMEARAETPGLIAAVLAKADPQIAQLPPDRIAMLVAIDDPTFWTNDGTDFSSPGAGYTTLTQGLGKQLYFPNGFHPGFEKIELILIAKFALTPLISKSEILRAALVVAYLSHDGQGTVIGFAEGAHRWFGRDLNQLSTDQFLALVAMLPAPDALAPSRHAAANAERVARIKRLLAHQCIPKGVGDVMLEGCQTI